MPTTDLYAAIWVISAPRHSIKYPILFIKRYGKNLIPILLLFYLYLIPQAGHKQQIKTGISSSCKSRTALMDFALAGLFSNRRTEPKTFRLWGHDGVASTSHQEAHKS